MLLQNQKVENVQIPNIYCSTCTTLFQQYAHTKGRLYQTKSLSIQDRISKLLIVQLLIHAIAIS